MDILEKIKSAIVKGRINMTDHADEELAKTMRYWTKICFILPYTAR